MKKNNPKNNSIKDYLQAIIMKTKDHYQII